jgi:hypothetical protein
VSEDDFEDAERYLRMLAVHMKLGEWTFDVSSDPAQDIALTPGMNPETTQAIADVQATPGRKHALIRLCDDFEKREPEERRYVLVHELVHIHLATVQEMSENDLDDMLGAPAASVWFRSFRRSLEYAVDGIATAMAEKLPLP